jgi:carbamoyl-phosphate synthase large subunit
MNIQFAVKDGDVYLLEVNPRASRTVPFVSKATGRPLAQIAAKVMAGQSLTDLGISGEIIPDYISVKEAVFPFVKFPGVDTLLGPEMKSTGEVMGIDYDFGNAYAKSQLGAGVKLPRSGKIFISVKDADKEAILEPTRKLIAAGFSIVATKGTAEYLNQQGIVAESINKVKEGRPHCVDAIKSGEICLVFNTTMGAQSVSDSYSIRRSVIIYEIAYFTTMEGIKAGTDGILAMLRENLDVKPLQEYYLNH